MACYIQQNELSTLAYRLLTPSNRVPFAGGSSGISPTLPTGEYLAGGHNYIF
jgi:hypothetical protein